jgi:glutamine amidotransferase
MIGIINYGLGNLKSVQNIVNKQNGNSIILNNPSDYNNNIDKLILPGVGSFDYGMQNLNNNNWVNLLNELVLIKKIPILGICLGMQLMCMNSEEGILNGLGWIDAKVLKFRNINLQKIKIPHMGWNTVEIINKNNLLFNSITKEQRFYFVHSYYVKLNQQKDESTYTNYSLNFTSAFMKDNIYGVQFHPEKSHKFGMNLINNFISI